MWDWLIPLGEWFASLSPSDWIALVGTSATVIALIFAAWQLHIAARAHNLNQEAQREALRPYVVTQVLPPRSEADSGRIGVKSFGKTAARDVHVSFAPPLPRLTKEEVQRNSISNVEIYIPAIKLLDQVFGSPIKTLVPDQQIECTYWQARKRYDGFLAPKRFRVTPEKEAEYKAREVRERAELESANAGLSADGFSADTKAIIAYKDDSGVKYSDSLGLDPAALQRFTFITTTKTTS